MQNSTLHFTFLTTFPEMFPGTLKYSLSGKALEKKIWSYSVINIKDFGITKHRKVDDPSYGGGGGMVMRPDVLSSALDFALQNTKNPYIFYMSPRGKCINQLFVQEMVNYYEHNKGHSEENKIIIVCSRFEGIDQRVMTYYNIQEISLGDFILSGGEIVAMALADCCIRLLEGVVANSKNLENESFNVSGETQGLLEYPLYTRPKTWNGLNVPEVLCSGNHEQIKIWRKNASEEITKSRRPDLWDLHNKKIKDKIS